MLCLITRRSRGVVIMSYVVKFRLQPPPLAEQKGFGSLGGARVKSGVSALAQVALPCGKQRRADTSMQELWQDCGCMSES